MRFVFVFFAVLLWQVPTDAQQSKTANSRDTFYFSLAQKDTVLRVDMGARSMHEYESGKGDNRYVIYLKLKNDSKKPIRLLLPESFVYYHDWGGRMEGSWGRDRERTMRVVGPGSSVLIPIELNTHFKRSLKIVYPEPHRSQHPLGVARHGSSYLRPVTIHITGRFVPELKGGK
jgi:hypothetical protein